MMNTKAFLAAFIAAFLLLTGCGTSELIMEDPLEISETVEATENSESCENVEKTAIEEDSVLEDIEEVNEVPHPDIEEEPEVVKEMQEEPEPEIVEETQDPEPQEVKTRYGTCTITHYCNCSQCCGQWAGGPTASGVMPEAGVTVAADLPFGTEIEINGERYTVQDRGVSGMWIDVYCSGHDEALARGMYTADVYIITYE